MKFNIKIKLINFAQSFPPHSSLHSHSGNDVCVNSRPPPQGKKFYSQNCKLNESKMSLI